MVIAIKLETSTYNKTLNYVNYRKISISIKRPY
ncbi:hypothetical protein SAMN06265348_102161 [Pedobacter westerhofensis]|uniref:Uncharacterized protein n=1 Tax=Pedobacter westerhofensis TaxID=425512 RepID=A0A521BBL6_9SPHI|nr:hypothetical protein SAMN06265348_102161 [Pedobacter westerhofensis]